MSRKPVEMDLDQLENLGAIGCTMEEVAGWFRCSERTVRYRLKREPWKSAWERGQGRGRATLRRLQWKGAEAGNATMLIWLGKQLLGQREPENTTQGTEGKKAIVALMEDLRKSGKGRKKKAADAAE